MADYQTWGGKAVYDTDDRKLGTIADLYYDEDATKPTWATVRSGLFGTKVHFVPLQGAHEVDDDIRLTVTEDQVKDAPALEANAELSPEEEDRLYDHYRLSNDDAELTAPHDDRHNNAAHEDDARSGRDNVADRFENDHNDHNDHDDHSERELTDNDAAHQATSRPEGPVTIGRHPVTGKRVRLQKYIVTEMVQTTVPIKHEEVRVVGEPIDEAAGRHNKE